MFRKLYPSVPNGQFMTQSGLVKDQGSQDSLGNGDISRIEERKQTVPGLAMGGLGGLGNKGFKTAFPRRDTYPSLDKSPRFGVAGIPPITAATSPRTNTNYLLQNTPQAVDSHRISFLAAIRLGMGKMNNSFLRLNAPSPTADVSLN